MNHSAHSQNLHTLSYRSQFNCNKGRNSNGRLTQACYASYFGSRSRSRSRAKILGGRAKNLSKFYNNEDDMLARSTVETWVIKAEKDSQDCCPKCGGQCSLFL